ncbi:50S ribosomal protein L16 [Candidatus Pyrohabitans sp.]
MAKLKPGKIYRIPKKRLYTRKEYIDSIPNPKITIFDMGDVSNPERFEVQLSLIAKETAQVTHNALEASRIAANRYITKRAGKSGFYMKFRVYPHVVLRENKMATGAGADRVSDGMRRAFGKPVGLAAVVREGQRIITLRTSPNHFSDAREALRRAAMKLPMPCGIVVEKGQELVR